VKRKFDKKRERSDSCIVLITTHPHTGIHGLPYQKWPSNDAWDGIPVRELDLTNEKEFGGFCTHSSILFLTWHRPYLALFEVSLSGPSYQALEVSPVLAYAQHNIPTSRVYTNTSKKPPGRSAAPTMTNASISSPRETSACHIGTGRFRRTRAPSSRSSR
jgi:hypothetical protein